MQLGDRRKATWLAIGAVAAIAFLMIQLLGNGPAKVAAAEADETQTAIADELLQLPKALQVDPFSHPRLMLIAEGMGDLPTDPAADATGIPPGLMGNGRPPLPFGIEDILPNIRPTGSSAPPNPDENTGTGRESEQNRYATLVLKAVMEVKGRVAYISVNSTEDTPFRANDVILEGIRVTAIDDEGVTLATPKGSVRLKVGGEVQI